MSKETESIHFCATVCASKEEYLVDTERWERYSRERLIKDMSFYLQREKAITTHTDNMVEKKLDVYVASPDMFWRIVREEAMEIARKYMRR